jgi:hypothetical protein
MVWRVFVRRSAVAHKFRRVVVVFSAGRFSQSSSITKNSASRQKTGDLRVLWLRFFSAFVHAFELRFNNVIEKACPRGGRHSQEEKARMAYTIVNRIFATGFLIAAGINLSACGMQNPFAAPMEINGKPTVWSCANLGAGSPNKFGCPDGKTYTAFQLRDFREAADSQKMASK